MANVNAAEIRQLLVPLPTIATQEDLVRHASAEWASREENRRAADRIEVGTDEYMSGQLGLSATVSDPRRSFSVTTGSLSGARLDPLSWRPATSRSGKRLDTKRLGDVASIGGDRVPPPEDPNALVPYVGLPECDLTRIREVVWRPYDEVRGRRAFRSGDILMARIEPSVFNRKFVWVGELTETEYAYTSGEFHVITPDRRFVDPFYLYAILFTSFFYSQIEGKTTGSSGRRRLQRAMLEFFEIPVPQMELQEEIATEIAGRQAETLRLRLAAESDWAMAKRTFEAGLVEDQTA
jgi:hypothetical protein